MEHRVKLVGVRYSLAIAALRAHLNNNRTMFILTLAADRIRATKSVQWLFEICPCDITYSTKLVFSQAYILAEVFAFENVSVQHHGEKVLISSGSAKLQTLKHECSDLKPYIFFLLPQVPDS